MVVAQTLIVYISLTAIMVALLRETDSRWINVRLLLALVIYSLVFGFRYGVGRDFFAYLAAYNDMLHNLHYTNIEFEGGFTLLFRIFSRLGLSATYLFFTIAFIQVFFVFKAQEDKRVYPYLAFTLMACCVWLTYCNGVRQQMAFCLFVFSLKYVEERHWLKHYAIIAIAASIHTSALLLVVAYPLLLYRTNWFPNIYVQYVLLFLSLILMKVGVLDYVIQYVDGLAISLGYDQYLDASTERYAEKLYSEVEWGIGAYLILLLNILLIYWSNWVKEHFSNKSVTYFYNFYFVGVMWTYIFNNSHIFGRINYYLIGFQYIIAAYTLLYLFLHYKKQYYMLLSLVMMLFVGYMTKMYTNTALYIFNWQDQFFSLKMDFFYI